MMTSPWTDRAGSGATVVVSSTTSDARTWNPVRLRLLLEEAGHRAVNPGACLRIPPDPGRRWQLLAAGFDDGYDNDAAAFHALPARFTAGAAS